MATKAKPDGIYQLNSQQRDDDARFIRALGRSHPERMVAIAPKPVPKLVAANDAQKPPVARKNPWPSWYEPTAVRRRTPNEVVASVAYEFDVTGMELKGAGRSRSLTHPRAVVVRILRERGMSFPQIGRWLGGRDHSTIINLHRNYDIYARMNPIVGRAYSNLREERKREV